MRSRSWRGRAERRCTRTYRLKVKASNCLVLNEVEVEVRDYFSSSHRQPSFFSSSCCCSHICMQFNSVIVKEVARSSTGPKVKGDRFLSEQDLPKQPVIGIEMRKGRVFVGCFLVNEKFSLPQKQETAKRLSVR